MPEEWLPVFALPNINTQDAVEGKVAALVSTSDPRIKALIGQHPRLKIYIRRFRSTFGDVIRPSFVIIRGDSKNMFRTVEAIASFRDAISISTVVTHRARSLIWNRATDYQYSNWFSFFPWMIDKDYELVVTRTPATVGLHQLEKMRGQSSPELFPQRLCSHDMDEVLLKELLQRWQRRFSTKRPQWQDRALFRSLNMAHAAALMPAHAEVTLYDIGKSVALWVSAFEILAHPPDSKSGLWEVYKILERVEWINKGCKLRRYRAYGKPHTRSNLACWIYGEIHHARNDFLHGNAISPSRLTTKKTKRGLFPYIAPLYRMALTKFLEIHWKEVVPEGDSDATTLARYINKRSAFLAAQRKIEEALMTIATLPGTPTRRRTPST